jgi:formylglycine-generating enzyme required for sulfatase activity
MKNRWVKGSIIVVGALIITALGIDAADTITGSNGTLLSQVISKNTTSACPPGMSVVDNISTVKCVDTFEESTGKACPVVSPEQMQASQQNFEKQDCIGESKKDALPWRFVTRDQAMQMCARGGKRLPTSEEWYTLSLGVANVEAACNVSSKNVSNTGAFSACVSPHGAYDLIGNVWEWVSDDVINGAYKTTKLPDSGYVAQVDAGGMATVISPDAQDLFGKDYFWAKSEGAYGIIRGGYYDSGTDAGVYTVHADTLPTSASIGIGFRCVK